MVEIIVKNKHISYSYELDVMADFRMCFQFINYIRSLIQG